VLPTDKADYVEKLQREGCKVCFVGDGVNDAIALKKAHVSVSLRGAASIATDTAHVVFMEQGLGKLCELRELALDLETNVRMSWALILAPNIGCIVGVFTLGFGIGMSVLTNKVAALAALANGVRPMLMSPPSRLSDGTCWSYNCADAASQIRKMHRLARHGSAVADGRHN
jgi:Cu2+-exporting ATPase